MRLAVKISAATADLLVMRLFPGAVDAWLPEQRLARVALKVVIIGVFVKLVLLPFAVLAAVLAL